MQKQNKWSIWVLRNDGLINYTTESEKSDDIFAIGAIIYITMSADRPLAGFSCQLGVASSTLLFLTLHHSLLSFFSKPYKSY